MKKIAFLLLAVFLLGANCFAQNESKFKTAKDNIEKSNIVIQNPKKNTNPSIWMDRGKLFQDVYNINVGLVHFEMATVEAIILFKNPKQILSLVENDVKKETYEYSQIKLNFVNGMLKTWEETASVVENPLAEAVKAYQQAASLDVKGKNTKKIFEAYNVISRDLDNKFFNEYSLLKFKDAYQTALQRAEVSNLLGFNDTLYYYYAGYSAYAQSVIDSSMWQKAIDCFEKAMAIGYKESGENGGQIYDLLYNAYTKIGDFDKALYYVKTGFEKFPNNVNLLYDLINYYMTRNENNKTLEYLEQAVARNPNDPVLLFAQGKMLDELGERDKSIAAYKAAIALDSGYFEPNYNMAVSYHNYAVILIDDANAAKTDAEFVRLKNLADDEFEKAVPFMEKAHELRPNDINSMETLKTLYYRLRSRYPDFENKYNEIVQMLEKLKQ